MLKNYFKIALRHLAKNKIFTGINVFGLALGMSLNLIFITILVYAFSYDDFHEKKDQIYRVITQVHDNLENPKYASAPSGLSAKLKEDFPGIENVIPVQSGFAGYANYADRELYLNGFFADPEFLKTFDFPLLNGSPVSALDRPNTVVLSEKLAGKIFGEKDPMGEIIKLEPYGDLLVTGILKNVPKNSHMHFEALASLETLTAHSGIGFSEREGNWKDFQNSYVYLLLPETTKAETVNTFLNKIAEDKYGESQDFKASFELQPLNSIVPGPPLLNNIGPNWSYLGIFLVGLITLIILIPACSNYITLSIAQSLNRMKEIGVRKVMGGSKKQIFFQLIMESIIMMLIALVLAYFIFDLIRKETLILTDSSSVMDLSPNLVTIILFIVFALFVGLAAGIIPAWYFAKIAPVTALKAKPPKTGKSSFPLQKIVIAAQFVLSIGFIMAVVIVIQQYRYAVNYDFAFEQEDILNVELQHLDPQILKNEFGKLSSIEDISLSSHLVGIGSPPTNYLKNTGGTDSIAASYVSIDEKFIPNLNLKLLAGQNFSADPKQNTSSIIVNEELLKILNISDPSMAINKIVSMADGSEAVITGVVQDFHYSNLLEPIEGFFFKNDPNLFKFANVQVKSRENFKDLSTMRAMWKDMGGVNEFSALFFDDQINDAYGFYLQIVKVWGFLGLLAITVACLGLLGIVVFTIKNRRKEVSIRKVLGASSENLVLLLSKGYIKLMVIASLIAVPLTYLLLDKMMAEMQHYRADIGFLEISISLIIVSVLGLTTIISQTLRAARANPVDNLKSE